MVVMNPNKKEIMKANKLLLMCLAFFPLLGLSQPLSKVYTSSPKSFSSSPDVNVVAVLYLSSGQAFVQPVITTDDPGPGQTYTYYWEGPNGFTSPLMQPQLPSLGTYMCTVTNIYGCSTTDQVIVQASLWIQNPLPSLCIGDTLLLDLYIPDPGTGSFSGDNVANRMFIATTSGSFTVTYTSGTEVADATTNVYSGPNVSVKDTAFNCFGNSVSLQALGFANNYAWSYVSDPLNVLSNNSNYSVVVSSPTQYLLTAGMVYSDKTCYVTDSIWVVPIVANFNYVQDTGQGPYGPIFGSNINFIPDYKTAYSYNWHFGNNYVTGGGTSNEMSPTYNYNPYYGYFTVTLTMNSFCGISTASKTVRVNYLVITGIEDNIKDQEINLYPNPAIDYIYLSFGKAKASHLQVFDLSGRIVSTEKIDAFEYRLDVSSYRSGTYVIKVFDENRGSVTAKFIKQ
ncbi:hypothetical protein P148_SR1C00001G1009 [candidate division SR1 bacterium RAAC1_SR1_1]|nr:hypothetical protein P148_SR1C00001G1009 [candidate division SR1 bacterium RAAC1_SR1_1]